MSEYLIVAAEASVKRVAFEVRVDDAPAYRSRHGKDTDHSAKLNGWVVQGRNILQIALALPDGAIALDEGAEFELVVLEGPHGEVPGPEGERLRWVWDRAKSPPLGPDFTVVHEAPFDVSWVSRSWSWLTAPPFASADRPLVEALVTDLHRALAARDVAGVLGHFAALDPEMDAALDLPPGMHAVMRQGGLETLFAAPDWRMEPLDLAALRLLSRSRGRIVEVQGPRGPALVGSGNGEVYGITPSLSRVAPMPSPPDLPIPPTNPYRIVR